MYYRFGIVLVVLAQTVWASRRPFEYYAPILERRPFGIHLPTPEPEPSPPPEPPAFTRHLRVVALRDSAAGVRVGIVDISARPPQSFFLYVGETQDGLTVVDADFERERALVRKDGIQDWIRMRDGDENAMANAAESAVATGSAAGTGVESGAPPAPRTSAGTGVSYAERRRQRLEAMRSRVREAEAPPVPDRAVLDRQLQEYQMNLIRQGKTPLPIPLSPEADDQLVAEGLLPPIEER